MGDSQGQPNPIYQSLKFTEWHVPSQVHQSLTRACLSSCLGTRSHRVCLASALALRFTLRCSSTFELDEIPCAYENGEYAAIAVLTALGHAKLTKGDACIKPVRMVSGSNTTAKATFDEGALPLIPSAATAKEVAGDVLISGCASRLPSV